MKRVRWTHAGMASVLWLLTGTTPVLACATCFGKSDSALAQGMNMGIFSLLAVIVSVLIGIASFFVYLARRSARVSALADGVPGDAQNLGFALSPPFDPNPGPPSKRVAAAPLDRPDLRETLIRS